MNKKKYLLDSNICVHLLRGRRDLSAHFLRVGWENCSISEITFIELLYGAECSRSVDAAKREVLSLCSDLEIIPISGIIEAFAREKAELRKKGQLIDDFDLLIGMTAQVYGYTLVTENVKHLSRISNIEIENWISR